MAKRKCQSRRAEKEKEEREKGLAFMTLSETHFGQS